MQISNEAYQKLADQFAPKSKTSVNCAKAFFIGGGICLLGQLIKNLYLSMGMEKEAAALLTGLGLYDDLARHGGAGTLVPITGFANAVSAPAIEFKTEGWVTGLAVKMFTIAGPVIVYGTVAAALYGLLYWLM